MFKGVELVDESDFFLKSLVKNVPIPNDAVISCLYWTINLI
jgi:hypothetical protein